jgi:hypothetical protein
MWTNEHMVSIDAKIISAGSDFSTQFEQLLEEPSASIPHTTVRPFDLKIDFFGIEAKDRALIDKDKTILLAKLNNLILWWSYNINILYGMWHTLADTLKAERKYA